MNLVESISTLGHLVGGRVIRTNDTFAVDNPATGAIVAECPAASVDLVEQAIAAAAQAQPAWEALGDEARRDIVRRMGERLNEHIAEIVAITALEKGGFTAATEGYGGPMYFAHTADTPAPIDVIEDTDDRLVRVVRKPLGVVAAIAPWNAPVLIICEKIAGALARGNTVVAKPSPFTPLATLALGELWKDIVPPGVLNIVAGGDDVGKTLVAHPAVRMITFTGSVPAGRHIAAAAADSLKRVVLELGGNDAAIVLPDVDVAPTAEKIFWSAFLMAGQTCAAIKRLYVHESIYDEMVAEMAKLAESAKPALAGSDGTLDPLTTRPQFDKIQQLLNSAIEQGARVEAGGSAVDDDGYFLRATILTNVKDGMPIVDDEQFGPVLPIIPFADVDDVIEAANNTEFGLSGSIWTSDIAGGLKLADKLQAGTVLVNAHSEIGPHIPFGGMKASGIGRAGGPQGADSYSELQTQYIYKSSERVKTGNK